MSYLNKSRVIKQNQKNLKTLLKINQFCKVDMCKKNVLHIFYFQLIKKKK